MVSIMSLKPNLSVKIFTYKYVFILHTRYTNKKHTFIFLKIYFVKKYSIHYKIFTNTWSYYIQNKKITLQTQQIHKTILGPLVGGFRNNDEHPAGLTIYFRPTPRSIYEYHNNRGTPVPAQAHALVLFSSAAACNARM